MSDTGSPGVGKSTFIDTLGMSLIEKGLKVAVLAIDPSSTVRGGSILEINPNVSFGHGACAFIRPSPSGGLVVSPVKPWKVF